MSLSEITTKPPRYLKEKINYFRVVPTVLAANDFYSIKLNLSRAVR